MLTTGSGAEALTMLETQPVDLIMLDLNLLTSAVRVSPLRCGHGLRSRF